MADFDAKSDNNPLEVVTALVADIIREEKKKTKLICFSESCANNIGHVCRLKEVALAKKGQCLEYEPREQAKSNT